MFVVDNSKDVNISPQLVVHISQPQGNFAFAVILSDYVTVWESPAQTQKKQEDMDGNLS